MRYEAKRGAPRAEGDMTPMIDMTFQLIAFFMVLVSFTDEQQDQQIHLPSSELAKPPETPPENPVTLQMTKKGDVLFLGQELSLKALKPLLRREYEVFDAKKAGSAKQATVVIRADCETKTGCVQEVIKMCQETGFEKFALRAKQQATVTIKKT